MTETPDSGTQPQVHYCTSRVRGDGTVAGCPSWPGCLFPNGTQNTDTAVAYAEAEREDGATLGVALASLLGWAAGAVLVMVVAAILIPFVA